MAPELARVVSLHIYPVKSCAGFAVDVLSVDDIGPVGDRRWMIVDENGIFVTQRKYAKMAAIRTALSSTALTLRIPDCSEVVLSFAECAEGKPVPVRVWSDDLTARLCRNAANDALSSFLGAELRLVYMHPVAPRQRQKGDANFSVSFADSLPFLLTNTASLADFNSRAGTDLPMSRFRPNIVVDSGVAFVEDMWQKIKIGSIPFRFGDQCDRCVITTVDQNTGKKTGPEPLKTLKTYRAPDRGIMFGQRLVHAGTGTIRVGDAVTV